MATALLDTLKELFENESYYADAGDGEFFRIKNDENTGELAVFSFAPYYSQKDYVEYLDGRGDVFITTPEFISGEWVQVETEEFLSLDTSEFRLFDENKTPINSLFE